VALQEVVFSKARLGFFPFPPSFKGLFTKIEGSRLKIAFFKQSRAF
jgi:hypothetical protein